MEATDMALVFARDYSLAFTVGVFLAAPVGMLLFAVYALRDAIGPRQPVVWGDLNEIWITIVSTTSLFFVAVGAGAILTGVLSEDPAPWAELMVLPPVVASAIFANIKLTKIYGPLNRSSFNPQEEESR